METVTAPASAAYEVAVQRQMIEMAQEAGTLRAELKIVRIRLRAIISPMDEGDWRKEELRDLVASIDRALDRWNPKAGA